MTFEKITKDTGRGGHAQDYIGMSCTKVGGGQLAGRIVFAAGVMSRMGLAPKSKVDLERGSGEHAGLLRISESGRNGWSIQRLKDGSTAQGFSGILSVKSLAAGETYKAAPVEYKIKDGALYITLPEWARG